MSNLGDYQWMTTAAKQAGGPDAWLDTIKKAAYNSGASDMKNTLVVPLLLTGIGLGSAGVIGYQKIKKWLSDKKEAKLLTEKEATQAEVFLKNELDAAIEEMSANEAVSTTKTNTLFEGEC